jgi:hypothetical protein
MRDDERSEGVRITLSEKSLSTIAGRIRRDIEVRIQINPSHPSSFVNPILLGILNDTKGINPDVVYPKL